MSVRGCLTRCSTALSKVARCTTIVASNDAVVMSLTALWDRMLVDAAGSTSERRAAPC